MQFSGTRIVNRMAPFFLLIGQSNMVGQGIPIGADIATNKKANLEMFVKNKWQPYRDPFQDMDDLIFASPGDRRDGIGPGLTFGTAMQEGGMRALGLMLCARDGAGLSEWGRKGQLYSEMRSRLADASARRKLCGVLIYFGEADAKTSTTAKVWKSGFRELVHNIRAESKQHLLPIVFAQIATVSSEWCAKRDHGFTGWDDVKKFQTAIKLEQVTMIKTDDLTMNADGIHLDLSAQRLLGRRFATAMTRLLKSESNQSIS